MITNAVGVQSDSHVDCTVAHVLLRKLKSKSMFDVGIKMTTLCPAYAAYSQPSTNNAVKEKLPEAIPKCYY